MFIKITKSGKYEYAQIVKSYRKDGRTKHKVILNLGRVDHIEDNPSFKNLALKLEELARVKNRVNLDDFSEGKVLNWGHVVYRKLWQQLGIDNIIAEIQSKRSIEFNLNDSCFLMALQHLLDPKSKLGTFNNQANYLQLPYVDFNHFYRSLDILAEHKETLEEALFLQNRDLLNMKVDVVFFDVTTFHFESVRADDLKDFGFSKDGKFNEVQVVLALMVDTEGRPIGYELFPGNLFETKTLERCREKLEARFGINQVIIVADKGINSKLNLKRIDKREYGYIVASRIKNTSESMQAKILDPQEFSSIDANEDTISYKIIEHTRTIKENGETYTIPENLIITHSDKRAQKDKKDRERLLEKAKSLLGDQGKIKASNKKGGKKYLKETGTSSYILDEEAITRDAKFDGYYGIQTNRKDYDPQKVLEAYHTLWKIEESFRIMKSTLEVRPVFHWTESRIKGHFVMCFIAFLLERTLELKLKNSNIEASPEKIREALNAMTFTEVDIDDSTYYIKNKGTDLSNKIARVMKIKPPKNITTEEELKL